MCFLMFCSENLNRMKRKKRRKLLQKYLSASVSVSLLEPVVVSSLERDGRAELRLAPPAPPLLLSLPPSAMAVVVPVDEVDAFLLAAPRAGGILLAGCSFSDCRCNPPLRSDAAAAAERADREPKLGWENRSELEDGTPSVVIKKMMFNSFLMPTCCSCCLISIAFAFLGFDDTQPTLESTSMFRHATTAEEFFKVMIADRDQSLYCTTTAWTKHMALDFSSSPRMTVHCPDAKKKAPFNFYDLPVSERSSRRKRLVVIFGVFFFFKDSRSTWLTNVSDGFQNEKDCRRHD